jgi:leader peptidase (prepilin peptidase) / N-methyltransferase
MIRALRKTGGRTGQFLRASLSWRMPDRQYAIVAWGLIAGAVWLAGGLSGGSEAFGLLVASLYLLGLVAAVCAIDARFGIIPNSLVAALAIGGAVQTLVLAQAELLQRGIEAGLALGGGYLFRRLYRALRGHDGLGQGDVKFAASAVLWVGLDGIPGLLLAAVASALASLLILKAQGYDLHGKLAISFGPHLALGLWLVWVFGPWQFGA